MTGDCLPDALADDLLALDPVEVGAAVGEIIRVLDAHPGFGAGGALFVLGAGMVHLLRRDGRPDADAVAVLATVSEFTPRRGLQ